MTGDHAFVDAHLWSGGVHDSCLFGGVGGGGGGGGGGDHDHNDDDDDDV